MANRARNAAIAAVSLAGISFGATTVSAQATPPTVPDAPHPTPAAATFALGFSRSDPAAPLVVWIYRRAIMAESPDGIRAPSEWLYGRHADGAVEWISSNDCPRIIGALARFERLFPAMFALPPLYGLSPEGAAMPVAAATPPDAVGYQAWGLARQSDGEQAYLAVSAAGGALADVINRADDSVGECQLAKTGHADR